MKISDCPKFDKCSAPICPLDPNMLRSRHRQGERSCFYLREYSKIDTRAVFWDITPRELADRVAKAYPEVITRYTSLKSALRRSSQTPSKSRKLGEVEK